MEQRFVKVLAFIYRPSFSVYKFILNFIQALKVWQSVARPEIPIRHRSLTLKTLWKLQSIVMSCVDSLVSVAIATQFLPFIAIIELPLYSSYMHYE